MVWIVPPLPDVPVVPSRGASQATHFISASVANRTRPCSSLALPQMPSRLVLPYPLSPEHQLVRHHRPNQIVVVGANQCTTARMAPDESLRRRIERLGGSCSPMFALPWLEHWRVSAGLWMGPVLSLAFAVPFGALRKTGAWPWLQPISYGRSTKQGWCTCVAKYG